MNERTFRSSSHRRFLGGSRLRRLLVTLTLVVITPLAAACRLSRLVFLGVGIEQRIGHLVGETYYAACLRDSGRVKARYIVLSYDPNLVANPAVMAALPPYFKWITNPLGRIFLRPLQRHPWCSIDLNHGFRTAAGTAKFFEVISSSALSEPFLSLPDGAPKTPKEVLRALDIPDREWYVVLHIRESSTFGQGDQLHDYRNAAVNDYLPAIDYLLDRGGAVIRLGDSTMTPLPPKVGLYDHALDVARDPAMDLVICSYARLFLGNSSGAFSLAATQGVRVLAVNVAPLGAAKVWNELAVSVPKIYKWEKSGDSIPFQEMFDKQYADIRDAAVLNSLGIVPVDTPPDLIRQSLAETLDPQAASLDEEYLASHFNSYFHDGNYSYGSTTPISGAFLRRYRNLLTGDHPRSRRPPPTSSTYFGGSW